MYRNIDQSYNLSATFRLYYSRLIALAVLIIGLFILTPLDGQNGLKGEYFDGQNFEQKIATRIDDNIQFFWNEQPPFEGMDPHVCSIRWTGKLKAPKTGTYYFSARVDDGIRVWVGETLVIDDWNLNDVGIFGGEVEMIEGQSYDFKVEYFNALNEAEITLLWEIPVKRHWFKSLFYEKKQVIAPEYFYHSSDELVAQSNPNTEAKPKHRKKKEALVSAPKETIKVNQSVSQNSTVHAEPSLVEEITEEVIKKYTPKNVHFSRAKYDILPESFDELDQLASFLERNDHLQLSIEGHTDDVGNAKKNLELSKRRAYAIARYLVKKGIKGNRIKAEGFGGTEPLVPSKNGVYHPQNRRVEFIITGERNENVATLNKG